MLIFGGRWDAPICDNADEFPETPTYASCVYCDQQFRDGDQGIIMPMVGPCDPDQLIGVGDGHVLVAQHRECQLAQVVGHVVGVCSCTGWQVGTRATAVEVARRVDAGELG